VTGLAPFQAPDEGPHWLTGLNRSQNFPVKKESKFCSRSLSIFQIFEAERLMFRPQEKIVSGTFERLKKDSAEEICNDKEVSYGTTLTYFSTLIGSKTFLKKAASAEDFMHVFYFARLLNGVLIALSLLRLLHNVRTQKLSAGLFCICALLWTPIFVQQSFAVSSDDIIILFAISTLSMVVSIKEFSWWDFSFFAVTGVIAACTKPYSMPIAAMPLIAGILLNMVDSGPGVDWVKGIIKKKDLPLLATFFIVCIAGFAFFVASGGASTIEHPPGVDSGAQTKLVLENPMRALSILNKSIWQGFDFTLFSKAMGYVDTNPPHGFHVVWKRIFYITLFFELCLLASYVTNLIQAKNFRRLALWIGASTLIVGLLYVAALGNTLALYLTFTPVGLEFVAGMQQRYFIHNFLGLAAIPMLLALVQKPVSTSCRWSFEARFSVVERLFPGLQFIFLLCLFFQFTMLASFLSMTWMTRYW
ncbi:MAG: DUF2142 domain-containing protein, partial [Proteobacteria bacterium]